MLWLAILGRLKTHDTMGHWERKDNMLCVFCGNVPDDHKHLFFECDYPREVSWNDLIECLVKRPINKSIWSILQRLVLGAAVFLSGKK